MTLEKQLVNLAFDSKKSVRRFYNNMLWIFENFPQFSLERAFYFEVEPLFDVIENKPENADREETVHKAFLLVEPSIRKLFPNKQ